MCLSGPPGRHGLALAAVAQNGRALRFASPSLRADKKAVLDALAQKGWVLEEASAELRADTEVVLAVVAQNGGALQFESANLENGGFKAFLESLLSAYTVPVHVFLATVLFDSTP